MSKTNSASQKLKKFHAENEGNVTFVLPKTKIEVVFPKNLKHRDWRRALSMAKNNITEAQIYYVLKIATFDGDKLTAADWNAYMPLSDANELLAEVFVGSDEDDDDWGDGTDEEAGNGQTTKA